MFYFAIRDVLWLTLVAAMAVGWRLEHRRTGPQIENLLSDNAVKTQALEERSQRLAASAKKEKSLQQEVELLERLVRNRDGG